MKVLLKSFVLELPTESGSWSIGDDRQHSDQLLEVLLEQADGDARHDGHALDGVSGT